MAKLIDFEREYMLFAASRLRGKADIKDDELTALLNDTMKEWLSTGADYLGGMTPDEYFSSMDAEALVELVAAYCDKRMNVPEPLYGRISGEAKCVPALKRLVLSGEASADARATAMTLLCDMNAEGLMEVCVAALSGDDDVSEIAAEKLKSIGYEAVGVLNAGYEAADDGAKAMILDVLACYPGVESTAAKLTERLYNDTGRRAFYANIAGKFGDESLLEPLEKLVRLSDMEYFDYIEIVNAIDALGGDPGPAREFYGDPDYEALRIGDQEEDN